MGSLLDVTSDCIFLSTVHADKHNNEHSIMNDNSFFIFDSFTLFQSHPAILLTDLPTDQKCGRILQ